MPYDNEFMGLIKATGLTVTDFARVCGVSKGTVYNGMRNPESLTTETRYKIFKAIVSRNTRFFCDTPNPLMRKVTFDLLRGADSHPSRVRNLTDVVGKTVVAVRHMMLRRAGDTGFIRLEFVGGGHITLAGGCDRSGKTKVWVVEPETDGNLVDVPDTKDSPDGLFDQEGGELGGEG